MTKEQYKVTGSDESYTYPSLVLPIIPHIEAWKKANNKENVTIWCPFSVDKVMDYGDIQLQPSNFVKIFRDYGYNVICSHIATDEDFFEFEPDVEWDLIIDNPPFKEKLRFFERALEFNKPFALVNTASWLNDGGLFKLFKDKPLQLLMPNKRSRFFNQNGVIGKSPSFKAIYYCYNFLQGNDIQWFELDRSVDAE